MSEWHVRKFFGDTCKPFTAFAAHTIIHLNVSLFLPSVDPKRKRVLEWYWLCHCARNCTHVCLRVPVLHYERLFECVGVLGSVKCSLLHNRRIHRVAVASPIVSVCLSRALAIFLQHRNTCTGDVGVCRSFLLCAMRSTSVPICECACVSERVGKLSFESLLRHRAEPLSEIFYTLLH